MGLEAASVRSGPGDVPGVFGLCWPTTCAYDDGTAVVDRGLLKHSGMWITSRGQYGPPTRRTRTGADRYPASTR